MPPTESTILTAFLLSPAALPTFLTLPAFTNLFPRSQRGHAQIPILYRELQHQRALTIDRVRRNIAAEVKRGEGQRRDVVRARQQAEHDEMGDAGDERDRMMEVEMFGPADNLQTYERHTLNSVLPEMELACASIEAEIEEINLEVDATLAQIRTVVGDLSDLRYGRFNKAGGVSNELGQDVMDGLKMLERTSRQTQKRI
ncbi:MAG: hypothetical protein M1825_001181 [Sarcosagium campestre]|nr:MAG: hypothetical protein M1825_001181 [Sarcosagium campestre]